MIRAGPMERALGCFSLQISTPDVASSRTLFQHLANDVLPKMCPVVAAVDLFRREEASEQELLSAPYKDATGRLRPCPLQLPPGSVLIVHYHEPSLSTNNSGNKSFKAALHELVQHHRLPYRFQGDVILPFESDYRIIVVTTQTQQLPCTTTVLAKNAGMGPEASSTSDEETVHMLRETLASGRDCADRTGRKSSLKLSSLLLERAQQDFLTRRRQAYDAKQQQQSVGREPSKSSLPGEDDFHRWLNITRLQAKSRHAAHCRPVASGDMDSDDAAPAEWEATVEDWEVALQLDDVIRVTE